MIAGFQLSHIHSFYFFLLFVTLFRSCLSNNTNSNVSLCIDNERRALLDFKYDLIDDANRLASWVNVDNKDNDCCKWAGIVCDNVTGHIVQIQLRAVDGHCHDDYNTQQRYDEILKQRLRGDLSSSLLHLKQLMHLDLSCNDFEGIQVPSFIGSFGNLRYLNLSNSNFFGTIPPQLGNLTELRILSLGSFYTSVTMFSESTSIVNMQWLQSLSLLRHLDMSNVNLNKAVDWFQVINKLPSLVKLYLSRCSLVHIYPHVDSLNITSLSVLDLSRNRFIDSFMPQWIFTVTSLVSLDLTACGFIDLIPNSKNNFRNLTSLKFLQVAGNSFMNSSLVLEGLSSVGSNLNVLDMSSCGVSSSVIRSLHNLTSLLSLDLSFNQINEPIPESLGNFCSLNHFDLSGNRFSNITIKSILESFFKCKSPRLKLLSLQSASISSHLPEQLGQLSKLVDIQFENNGIVGIIPDSIGQLHLLKSLNLQQNLISGPIPYSIGALVLLESLYVSDNQLNGSLPASLGQLSKLVDLDISNNLLQGVVTEAHFSKLTNLKYLYGMGNNLTFRPHLGTWIPPFNLFSLYTSSWNLGPQFPKWLLSQSDLTILEINNTSISSTMPLSFWTSLPNLEVLRHFKKSNSRKVVWIPITLGSLSILEFLDLCNNKLSGRLPAFLKNLKNLKMLQLAGNELVGNIPMWVGIQLSSLSILNLRSNNFDSNIPHELCYITSIQILDLADNQLSGDIPSCFNNFSILSLSQRETNLIIPFIHEYNGHINIMASASLVTKGHEYTYNTILHLVMFLDLSSNNLSGSIPSELMDLHALQSLNLSENQLTGMIPKNIGDLKSLESFDVSLNHLYGELPVSLSRLSSLSNFNVSVNSLSGRIPSSTQLQSFSESSFFGNKLCGAPLTQKCGEVASSGDQEDSKQSRETDWGLIISILSGFVIGFWMVVTPLMVGRMRSALFRFLRYISCNTIPLY